MIALIDGDSIAFILGWAHREHQNKEEMYKSIDEFLENLFIMTGATMYYGALASDVPCFRYDVYKVKPYKGNRPELKEHMEFWRPVVTSYLKDKWKFDSCAPMEADDLIYTAHQELHVSDPAMDYVICSPDKDLKQIPGMHYDYRTNEFCIIDSHQARYQTYRLMLEGDDSDNIAGIPGFGPKKAEAKLKLLLETNGLPEAYHATVLEAYQRHFGPYYGNLIFQETMATISLRAPLIGREITVQYVPKKSHPFEQLNSTD